jgi:hypothetical protein
MILCEGPSQPAPVARQVMSGNFTLICVHAAPFTFFMPSLLPHLDTTFQEKWLSRFRRSTHIPSSCGWSGSLTGTGRYALMVNGDVMHDCRSTDGEWEEEYG